MYQMLEFENSSFKKAFIEALEKEYSIKYQKDLAINVFKGNKTGAVSDKEYCYKCVHYSLYGQTPTRNDIEIFKDEDICKREYEIAEELSGCKGIVTMGLTKILSFSYDNEKKQKIYCLCFVMEMDYYEDDLAKKIKDKKFECLFFDEKEIIQIGIDICDALISMHKVMQNEKNYVHNDIKPENIFVNSRGDYVLGDFGVSREVAINQLHKTTGGLTMKFVSPEIYQMWIAEIDDIDNTRVGYDHRSDIYSLGTVLYMLSNNYIVQDTNERSQNNFKMPEPSGKNISNTLKKIIMKAVEVNPNRRFQSAIELRTELDILRKLDTENNSFFVFEQLLAEQKEKVIFTEDSIKNENNASFDYLYIKAQEGQAEFQLLLGNKYKYGDGVKKDYAEAIKWYKKAFEQGEIHACNELGVMYAEGKGVKKDYVEAVKYWRITANAGYANAQCALGLSYELGEGVPKDYKEAIKWYKKATEQGYKYAQERMNNIYSEGFIQEE